MRKAFALLFILSCFQSPAHAYLDPGTGSLMMQLIFGGVAGLLVFIKIFWGNIKQLFCFGANPQTPNKSDDSKTE